MLRKYIHILIFFLCLVFGNQAYTNNEIPSDFSVIFQRPSYIIDLNNLQNKQLGGSGSIYRCDDQRDECKVNLKIVEPDLTNLSSRLECKIDFGFESDQSSKCNPNTVVLPQGEHKIDITVWERKYPQNQQTISYIILNGVFDGGIKKPIISEKIKDFYSGEFQPKTVNIISSEPIIAKNNPKITYIPDTSFDYIFQRPSYVTGTGGVYVCDRDREECKINLKLVELDFTDLSSTLKCEIDFGFESDQSNKCNPNTIILPEGGHEIKFKVYSKNDPKIFSISKIYVSNIPISINQKTSGVPQQNNITVTQSKDNINLTTSIIIQSKNSKNRIIYSDKIVCFDVNRCNINLNSQLLDDEPQGDLSYNWDFGNGQYSDTQNPIGIWYGPGKYNITLTLSDIHGNTSTDTLELDVRGKKNIIRKTKAKLSYDKKISYYLLGKGIIQSKNSQHRVISGNKVICTNIERCNVNFNSEIETNGVKSHIEYYWDFGNGEYSTKQNPSGIWYTPGEYEAILIVSDEYGNTIQNTFQISVKEKIDIGEKQIEISSKISHAVHTNYESLELGKKVREIDKKVRFSQSIVKQKKSLKIYGRTIPNTTIYIFFGDKKHEVASNEKGNYSLKLNYLQPGKYTIMSHVVSESGEIYEVPRIKVVELSLEYIDDMNARNNKIYQNRTKKTTQKNPSKMSIKKELSIISKAQASNGDDIYNSTINFKLLNTLLGIMSILMIYLVLKRWRII